MAHLINLLVTAASQSPARINLLLVLLVVLTAILLILFVGFLLSGRRRGNDKDAEDRSKAAAPHTPDDGFSRQERVIYHAQPRPILPTAAVPDAPPERPLETIHEAAVVQPPAPVEPEPQAHEPAPPEAPPRT